MIWRAQKKKKKNKAPN